MTPRTLPFERAFRDWIDQRGMGWERLTLPLDGADASTAAYRFSPRGRPRRVVCAFHGAGNDALFAWVGLFKRLLQADTEIFTFDLPGHGRANRTRFSPETAAAAVGAAISECAGRGRNLPVHAIGVSLGGSLLLAALPVVQRSLTSATLIVAPLRIHLSIRSALCEIGPRTLHLLWREREHYGLTGLIPSFGPFKRDIYPLRLADAPPDGPFGYVEILNRSLDALDLESRARRVAIPLLLVYGEKDRIVDPSQGERLRNAIPGADHLLVRRGTHLSTPLEPVTIERVISWIEALG